MIINFDTNKCDWVEATYGVQFTKIDDVIVYWNVYDDYFMVNKQKFKREKYQNNITIEVE